MSATVLLLRLFTASLAVFLVESAGKSAGDFSGFADDYCRSMELAQPPHGASAEQLGATHNETVANMRYYKLIQLVNASAAATFTRSINDAAPYTDISSVEDDTRQGPSLTVTIISRVTPAVYAYAAYSTFLQYFYAHNNGYVYMPPLLPDSSTPDFEFHRKLVPLLEIMSPVPLLDDTDNIDDSDAIGNDYKSDSDSDSDDRDDKGDSNGYFSALSSDYLVWLDADCILLAPDVRLEQIAAAKPEAHVLLSADASNDANTGMIIVKNSAWAVQFLRDWVEFRKQHSTEQQGFSGVMSQYRNREQENREKRASNKNNRAGKNGKPDKVIGGGFEVDRKVAILPAHVLNSEAPALGRQLPSHKVLHLAAESEEYRRTVFSKGAANVCKAYKAATSDASTGAITAGGTGKGIVRGLHLAPYLSPQMGLNQERLLRMALDVYRRSARAAVATAIDHALRAKNGQAITTTAAADLKHLRAVSSKYAYTTLVSSGGEESSDSLHMRWSAYSAIRAIVDREWSIVRRFEQLRVQEEQDKEIASAGANTNTITNTNTNANVKTKTETKGMTKGKSQSRDPAMLTAPATDGDTVDVMEEDLEIYRTCVKENLATHPDLSVGGTSSPHSVQYCVRRLIDDLTHDLPDRLKLAAEVSFEYLTALSAFSDEAYAAQEWGISTQGHSNSDNSNNSLRLSQKELRAKGLVPKPSESRSGEERAVSEYLESLLHYLMAIVHSSQKVLVMEMQAGLFTELGAIALHRGDLEQGRKYLNTAVGLFLSMQKRGVKGDYRTFAHAEALLGAALCQAKLFTEGLKKFERAIDMAVDHLRDEHHVTLIPKYYNAGMCMRESGSAFGTRKMLTLVQLACGQNQGHNRQGFEAYCRLAGTGLAELADDDKDMRGGGAQGGWDHEKEKEKESRVRVREL